VILAPEEQEARWKAPSIQKGGFIIALLARIPVVPVVISGGYEICPKVPIDKTRYDVNENFPPIDVKACPK
jgi:1-acyl-sn-glycerol-3-phosphate acyltransferase